MGGWIITNKIRETQENVTIHNHHQAYEMSKKRKTIISKKNVTFKKSKILQQPRKTTISIRSKRQREKLELEKRVWVENVRDLFSFSI